MFYVLHEIQLNHFNKHETVLLPWLLHEMTKLNISLQQIKET